MPINKNKEKGDLASKTVETTPDNKILEKSKDPITENYILYGIFSSLIIGGLFIYLFLWKTPGISHLLFYLLVSINAFVPALIWEPKRILEVRKTSWIFLILALFASSIFMFRLQPLPLSWAFLTLPVIYAAIYASVYNPGVVKRLGLLSYISLPAILLASWFADGVNLLINFRFRSIKSEKTRSIVKRVIAGIFVSLPVLFLFTILMISADYAFADLIEDSLRKIFGEWIKLENLVKLFIGGMVSVYFAVFNFSIWNRRSALSHFLNQYAESRVVRIKQSWDPLIFNVVLLSVNILFLLFIIVQFAYLFGGEDNVIRGGYTYAEYARRGFKELLMIAVLVYGLVYVLNLKVRTYTKSQLTMYKVNYLLLLLMTMVINLSAHTRLYLTEAAYGYTGVRIMGHFIMFLVGAMIILLASFSLWKEAFAYINKVNAVMIALAFFLFLVFPGDYLVGTLNVNRFKESGLIDLPYFLSLSDEAVPAFIELAEYSDTPEVAKAITYAELGKRRDQYKHNKDSWQSFNLLAVYNKELIDTALEEKPDFMDEADLSLQDFLEDYSNALLVKDYEAAHDKFWSENTEYIDEPNLQDILITKYDYLSIPQFNDWALLDITAADLSGSRGFDYWSGMYIDVDMEYRYQNSNGLWKNGCRTESIRVKLENGEWKISDATQLKLGVYGERSSEGYHFDDSLEYLFDSSWGGCY